MYFINKPMGTIKFSLLGKRTFLISFWLGTLLLVAFWMTNAEWLAIVGFYYLIIVAIANFMILLHELLEYLNDVSEKKSSGNSVLLLLVNIPIAFGYFYLFLHIVTSSFNSSF
ncbi:MAG TPA: hypothetical protein DCQ68_13475 [Chryseobacterium indologenes]|nr:hypothetical protein [Chryseobacterium indologenes]